MKDGFSRQWEGVTLFPASASLFLLSALSPFASLFLPLHTFFVNFPSAAGVLLACLSISRRTPTCSDVDCYAERIAPYTPTCSCKSCIENVEVFSSREGRAWSVESAYYLRVSGSEFCAPGRPPGKHRGSAVAWRDPQEEAAQAERIMGPKKNSHNEQDLKLQEIDFSISISFFLSAA